MSKLYIIPDLGDMERVCSLADQYGCGFEYNDFHSAAVLDNPEKQEEIIAAYAKYRSDFSKDTMHGAFLDVTIHSSDPLIRDASMLRIRQSMEIAARMGLKGVVFHTGRLANFRVETYLTHWLEENVRFFTELAQKYPKQQIYMENMFDEAPDILAHLAERMKEVSNFGVCLDYAHAALTCCPQEEWMNTLAPYIRHMHINDNDGKNDLHQAVGAGCLDWAEFNRLASAHHVNASVLVEVNGYERQKQSLEYLVQHKLYPLNQRGEAWKGL